MAAPEAKAERLYKIPEAAVLLGVSRATVYRYITDGLLDTNAAGRGTRPYLRVSESAIARFQASTALKPPTRGRRAA
jgi:excisionase family DNA binding protein